MKTFVLYHAHCADGFGAAYAAWTALGADGVEYIPVSHGDPVPKIPDGSRVFIVDFSYDRETILSLKARMSELRVIDHHQTAQAALQGLDCATFDMNKSGAILTWEHFQGTGACIGEPPTLLQYVQDRDLWKWELPMSREISAALAIHDRCFEWWDKLARRSLRALEIQGGTLLESTNRQVKSIADRAHVMRIDSQLVMAANTPVLISETAEELLRRHTVPFVACYYDAAQRNRMVRIFSLRSGPQFDVSEVAKKYGGGGHKQAAGFTMVHAWMEI